VALEGGPIAFPEESYSTPEEKKKVRALVEKARVCGTGFDVWNWKVERKSNSNCNREIAEGFEDLRKNYRKNKPISYLTHVPLKNLGKILFKRNPISLEGKSDSFMFLVNSMFLYRSLLVVLGVIGLFVFYRFKAIKLIGAFGLAMYILLAFFIRQVEMRYLLQIDVLLIIPATLLIFQMLKIWKRRRNKIKNEQALPKVGNVEESYPEIVLEKEQF